MLKNKIILIQIWLGIIPDYFWFHYETTKNTDIDFLFVTDQNIVLDSKNYKVIKTTKKEIESKLSNILGTEVNIKNNKKICDLKASFGDLYHEYVNDYDYFGCYDIDTFFGDIKKYIDPFLGKYDFISVGDENYHNRLSGPFLLIKNTEELKKLYLKNDFIECFEYEDVKCYEEHQLDKLAKEKYSIKLINSTNVNVDGKIDYNCIWSGNKCFINDNEIMLHHFYNKNETKIVKNGNIISSFYHKQYIDDFLWVAHFSQNYEKLVPYLIDSISKYSNRKCVFYTINYNSSYQYKTQYNSEQFIFRRIDLPEGKKDNLGRDSNIMNSKPAILLDAIETFKDKKFVHIDTDIYFTVNADKIIDYFDNDCNYPLINSHIHDTVYLRNIVPNEEWSSPIHILLENLNIQKNPVSPRRKCNIILFDKKSKWFFEEQMMIYEKFKHSNIPGILSIFDEDTANAVLTKYDLKKSLPLIDIEDSYVVDINKYTDLEHPFHMTGISNFVKLPKTKNDILFFHNFKNINDYENIITKYGNNVLDCEDIILLFKDNTIFFTKNSFLVTKKIEENIDFIVKDLLGNEVEILKNQDLHKYSIFYISNTNLTNKYYIVEIVKTKTKEKIYNNILCTTQLI
jgi:hypothetical protein